MYYNTSHNIYASHLPWIGHQTPTYGLTPLFPSPAPILKGNAPGDVEAVELLGSWLDPKLSGTLCIWRML